MQGKINKIFLFNKIRAIDSRQKADKTTVADIKKHYIGYKKKIHSFNIALLTFFIISLNY